ncbi:unnamed protein product [Blepharisma stoltei]|uniref:Uncharacterized protein n=1 Tax=Blepharisma stoltei TaxID=1481888 RepID=A0AAU9ISU3_9CILI|nr:unnamed protein product [Blepharisma stoltei]
MEQPILKQKRSEIIKTRKIKKPKGTKKKDFSNSKYKRAYENYTPWNKLRVNYHNNDWNSSMDWGYRKSQYIRTGGYNAKKTTKLLGEIKEKNKTLEKFYEILDKRHSNITSIVPNKKFDFSKYLKQYLNSSAMKNVNHAIHLCTLTDF